MFDTVRKIFRIWSVPLALAIGLSAQAASAQQAGTLVSADPVVDTPPGQQAWRVRYATTDANGAPRVVTGMVVAPREQIPVEGRKVIAWTHGTWGVAERCAPSLSANFFAATPALADMVARGYVVVAPDYPGLGSAMPHPYLVIEDTGRSVLDAVRAARAIPGAASGTRFAVWGESQGGHAALATGALARRYAPELSLVGTAAAAPPTDLRANFSQGSDANVRAMLTAFTTYSWSQHFGASLSTVFKPAQRGIVTRLAQNNCIELGATPRLGTILGVASVKAALKGKDLGRIAPWAAIMRSNSIDPRLDIGPMLIAQSVDDPIVAPSVTRAFAKRACRERRRLRFVSIPGGDHGNSARNSATETLAWIDARFVGTLAPSDCGSI